MSATATLPKVEVTVPKRTVEVEVRAKAAAKSVSTSASWAEQARRQIRRAARRVGGMFSRLWSKVRSGARWLKNKIVKAVRWTRDKIVAAYKFTRDKVVKPVYNWVVDKVPAFFKRASAWMKSAAIGAWRFTAPVRGWIATPFRLAFGTSIGVAGLLAFGGKALLAISVPWVIYLLVSGRMMMVTETKKEIKAKKVKKAKKAVKKARKAEAKALLKQIEAQVELAAEDPMAMLGMDDEETRELTVEQVQGLTARENDVIKQGEKYGDAGNKQMLSNYAGRLFLVTQRKLGSMLEVEELYAKWVQNKDAYTDGNLTKIYIPSQVRKGMFAEDKLVTKILEVNVNNQEPTPVG